MMSIRKQIVAFLGALVLPLAAENPYHLVWNQDFAGTELPACWNIETNGNGGGNNELQYYCAQGVSLGVEPTTGKHCLILTATKKSYEGKTCISGRVNTMSNTYFTYGKLEARIKFPKTANGLWPAFWTMGNNYSQVGWPKCGENDIIEMGNKDGFAGNNQEKYFSGAMHVGSNWDADWCESDAVVWPYSVQDSFHIITCEWTDTAMTMYMDHDAHPEYGPYFTQKLEANDNAYYNRKLIFSRPNFIIFNLAVGGNFPGIYDINQITALANHPQSMYVDWVRLYQKGNAGESFQSNVASEAIEEVASGLNEVESAPQAEKMMINGKLYIRKNGKLYSVDGRAI